MTDGSRICPECGHASAPNASFCRQCGTRYEEPRPPTLPPPPAAVRSGHGPSAAAPPPRGGRRVTGPLLLALAIVVAGGLAATLLLAVGGSSETTTVTVGRAPGPTEEPSARPAGEGDEAEGLVEVPKSSPGTLEAGRYAQAGTFKFVGDAEEERRRLARDGIEVEVARSEEAQELYPGFQVLLRGPLRSAAAERSLLARLRHDGVPSAFVRPLTPARAASPSELGGGTWTGKLEESSAHRPRLDRSLRVRFVASADGTQAKLDFADPHCVARLRAESPTGPSLRFDAVSGCFAGTWRARPAEGGLMLSLLPADSDLVVLGELHSA